MVIMEIPAASQAAIARHGELADQAADRMATALLSAGWVGAEGIRQGLVAGRYGIRPETQHPGSGLAGSVQAWEVDRSLPMVALGVPYNAGAAAYARILEEGGEIRPRNARALAVPVTAEARMFTSPREMPGLTLIPANRATGRPALLVRQMSRRGSVIGFEVLWVLVARVYIAPRRWLSRGVEDNAGRMVDAFADLLGEWLEGW